MQQSMNQGRVQFRIVWLLQKCLPVQTLSALVFRLLVSRLGRRGIVRGQRGTGAALREGAAGGKKKDRREQRKRLNRGGLSWHIDLQRTYQATNGDSIPPTSMGKAEGNSPCVGNDENLQGTCLRAAVLAVYSVVKYVGPSSSS